MALSCKKAQEFIQDAFFNDLSEEQRIILDSHLTNCTCCKQYNEQILSIGEAFDFYREEFLRFKEFIEK